MTRLNIDLGIEGNPATGDTLRTAMSKINDNFQELYLSNAADGNLTTSVTNGNVSIQPNGTGNVEIDALSVNSDNITSLTTNSSVTITGNGTAGVDIEALSITGTSISSSDSSTINLNENVTVDGDLVVTGSIAGTFTVSSLDADSSTVSNLEVDNFKASAIVIESEGIGSNDNDTTIPTSAAVKDYVDTNAGTGTFTFSGNTISGPSNADVEITPGGTGNVNLNGDTVRVGDNNTDATVTTQGTGDLTLSTNGGTNSGTIKIADGANGDITLDTDGTGDVLLKGDKVGIGTVNQPDTLLHLKDTNAVITLQRTADANTPGLSFQNSNGNVRGVIKLDGTSGTSNEIFMQTYDGSSQAERFRVTHTGAKVSGTLNVDDGVSITDNTITSSASNADLEINASGTGTVVLENLKVGTGATVTTILDEDNMASNSATALATQQSIKAYVDAEISGVSTSSTGDLAITGSSITAPSNADLTLSAGGTGSVDIEGIQIKGTELSSSDSTQITIKENLHVTGTISGTVDASGLSGTLPALNGSNLTNVAKHSFRTINVLGVDGVVADSASDTLQIVQGNNVTIDVDDSNDRLTFNVNGMGDLTFTGSTISAPSNANLTLNAGGTGSVDIDGIQIKGTEISSSDSTQITIKENLHVTGNITGTINANQLSGTLPAISGELLTGVAKHAFKTVQIGGGNSLVADDPVDTLTIHPGNNVTITDDQASDAFTINVNGMGDLTFVGSTIISPSNADITLDPSGTGGIVAQGPVTFNAGYIEKINSLTSSSTITVDCSAASIHTVTLATNTGFVITNLPTGGTVTLIITQDGSGSRTATFGTDGSTAVKFPGGAPTLSTGAGDIDVVTIINDGTNFLGNCAKDYA